jgi:diaminopropionate ammonia-lyase
MTYFINRAWRPSSVPILDPLLCQQAFHEIREWPRYEQTPLHSLHAVAAEQAINLLLYKDEGHRFGLGSFKALGAPYALAKVLSRIARNHGKVVTPRDCFDKPGYGVGKLTAVCATDGNHGRALAWACSEFGCNCRVYVPSFVSAFRRREIERFGAHVTVMAGDYDDVAAVAEHEAARNKWLLISDVGVRRNSIPALVMRGYGVIVYEVLRDIDFAITHCFLQAGGGGFASTMAELLCSPEQRQPPKIIVVEPETAAGLFISALNSSLTPAEGSLKTIAGGLSVRTPSPIAWRILRRKGLAFMTVNDAQILAALRRLAKVGITAGETGAAGFAGFIAAAGDLTLRAELNLNTKSNILVIGTEGATDPHIYQRLIL